MGQVTLYFPCGKGCEILLLSYLALIGEADFQTCSTFGTRTMLGLLRHYPTMTAIHTSGTTFRQAVCIMLHAITECPIYLYRGYRA